MGENVSHIYQEVSFYVVTVTNCFIVWFEFRVPEAPLDPRDNPECAAKW